MGLLNKFLTQGSTLLNNTTDLSTQYPATTTGTPTPINNPGGPTENFAQIYNSNTQYLNTIPLLNNIGLNNTLNITNLDAENPGVQGGPNADITTVYPSTATGTPTPTANPGGPVTRFNPSYSPSNTYLDYLTNIGPGRLKDTLNITNLDVENPGVQGGPNNDTTTVYPASTTGTPTPTANPGGPVENFDHPYTPSNTYLDSSYNVNPNNTILSSSLDITNLDVENPRVQGGPNSDTTTVYPPTTTGTPTSIANPGGPVARFSQPYTPDDTYLNNISFLGVTGLNNTLDITNLDVENPGVQGGPKNDITTVYPASTTGTPTSTANPGGPTQRFIQSYTPNSTYLDTSYNVNPNNTALSSSLNITNLDVEDPGVQGGPKNDTTTVYPPLVTGTPTSTANPGGPTQRFSQPYTPENTYLESYPIRGQRSELRTSLNITNLDVEDPGVNGGIPYNPYLDPTVYPIYSTGISGILGPFSFPALPAQKFDQKYNPKNNYINDVLERAVAFNASNFLYEEETKAEKRKDNRKEYFRRLNRNIKEKTNNFLNEVGNTLINQYR